MRFFVFFIMMLSLFAMSCGREKATQLDLQTHLPGLWEAELLKVKVNTANNTDSTYTFEANADNWIQQFQVKPFRTYYQEDNKYRIEHRMLNDSLLNMSRGIWNVFGDTLIRIESNATYQYIVKLEPGRLEYHALVDWDGDGQEDDEYLEVQRFLEK